MDRFEELRAFVRIVEAGSITGAADALGLAKSAVSRRLADLERRLDTQLVTRSTRRMALTDAGHAFYADAARLLGELESAEQQVRTASAVLRGRLRVAAPLSFGLRHIGPAVLDFAAEHPEIEFDLDFDDRQVDLVAEGFDLGIRIARLGDSALRARRLTRVRRVVVGSPALWKRHGRPTDPAALSALPALEYANAPVTAWRYTAPDGRVGDVRLQATLRANNGDFIREACEAGLGVALQPTFIVHDAITDGRLQPALTEYQWEDLDAWAVYPPNRHLAERTRVFAEFLSRRFGAQPYWDDCLETADAP